MLINKKLSKTEEKRTAYHEAGHAVAFFLFGQEIEFVTIVPDLDKNYLGLTQPKREPFIPHQRFNNAPSIIDGRLEFERQIIISLAGYVAEIKLGANNGMATKIRLLALGESLKLHSEEDPTYDGDFGDVRLFFSSFISLNGNLLQDEEQQAYLQWLWLRTVNLITAKNTWKAVQALTSALLENKRLTGDEAKKIMGEKSPNFYYSLMHVNEKQEKFLLNNWVNQQE